jgi:hypothetical protein
MDWVHLGHCVDMLLQNIKCTANTEVLTLSWMEEHSEPWPDFSINRQCGDFDLLLKWQEEHAIDYQKFDEMPVPEGAYLFPAPWKQEKPEVELDHPLGEHQLGGEGDVLGDPHAGHGHRHE